MLMKEGPIMSSNKRDFFFFFFYLGGEGILFIPLSKPFCKDEFAFVEDSQAHACNAALDPSLVNDFAKICESLCGRPRGSWLRMNLLYFRKDSTELHLLNAICVHVAFECMCVCVCVYMCVRMGEVREVEKKKRKEKWTLLNLITLFTLSAWAGLGVKNSPSWI
jgi:hypothetical protein